MSVKQKVMELKLDYKDPFIKSLTKRIIALDIETSLVTAKVFSTGNQYIQAKQLSDQTRLLTVAYGSVYDMEHKGKSAVKCLSNRHSKNFKNDPHDDRDLLHKIWQVLDKAEVIIAHNAQFDQGWMHGRFLELGWPLPSRYFVFCTYQNLRPFKLTSKKLDELSQTLVGTAKLPTDYDLWVRCSNGDVDAFKEMEEYNRTDVYDTLFKVWKRTAYYNPIKAIDFTNYDSDKILCRVDGQPVIEDGTYFNRKNQKRYLQYKNPRSGQVYIDKYNIRSKLAGTGIIKPKV